MTRERNLVAFFMGLLSLMALACSTTTTPMATPTPTPTPTAVPTVAPTATPTITKSNRWERMVAQSRALDEWTCNHDPNETHKGTHDPYTYHDHADDGTTITTWDLQEYGCVPPTPFMGMSSDGPTTIVWSDVPRHTNGLMYEAQRNGHTRIRISIGNRIDARNKIVIEEDRNSITVDMVAERSAFMEFECEAGNPSFAFGYINNVINDRNYRIWWINQREDEEKQVEWRTTKISNGFKIAVVTGKNVEAIVTAISDKSTREFHIEEYTFDVRELKNSSAWRNIVHHCGD